MSTGINDGAQSVVIRVKFMWNDIIIWVIRDSDLPVIPRMMNKKYAADVSKHHAGVIR
jgi:hypothetical protein